MSSSRRRVSPLLSALPLAGMLIALSPADAAQAQDGGRNALGAQIAAQGAPGAAACASCHGARGEGNGAAGFPRLAAQPREYLSRQMQSYVDGTRKNAVMEPIAKALQPEQRDAVSAYYAGLDAPAARAAVQPAAAKRGRTLATVGDNQRPIQACENCHGPGGTGEPPDFPYLAGQHSKYLQATLNDWKSGARNNDPSQQMPMIAKQMQAEDMAAVSDYYASLTPPRPADAKAAPSGKGAAKGGAAKGAADKGAAGKGAGAPKGGGPAPAGTPGAAPAQGSGSEGGTPTTGSQGPGGGGGATGSGPSGSRSGGTP